jgi:hypothetical protein
MTKLCMAILMGITAGACVGVDGDEPSATAEGSLGLGEIFRERFDQMTPGNVDGQNGWVGNCTVTEGTPPDKYLKCTNGSGTTKATGSFGAGNYTLLVDIGPNNNVVNSTHGKFSLEGPQGRVFQIAVGCDNIRVAFQMNGPIATLAAFPCQSLSGPPAYRVVCNWSTGGNVLSCGAAKKPADPTTFVNLAVPTPLRPFNAVQVSSFALPGATLVDNIYMWQN